MKFKKFLTIAYRDLARNRRRTGLTALAVALGLVIVMAFSSLIAGMYDSMLKDNIRLSTGHLQIQNKNYEDDKTSLLYKDLLEDGDIWASQTEALPEVQSAAPVLMVSGLLSTPQESTGISVIGIDPQDAFHDPIKDGITAGEYLMSDDRGRILVGRGLADQMGITVGRRVSLAISNTDGQPQEGIFTVAGLFDTGFPGIDHNRVILPLEQAQTFSGVSDRVSSIILMLHNREDTANLAAKFTGPDTQVRTWEDLNAVMLESLEIGIVVYYLIYLIIFLVVAVLIANTLLMSVFARAREIGILASLGMKQRQIMSLFFLEGFMLALFGIAMGWVLGLGVVYYLANVGFSIPAETAAMAEGFTMGTTIYGGYAPGEFVILSLLLLAIVSLASLYPAWFAAKMEPVEALNTL